VSKEQQDRGAPPSRESPDRDDYPQLRPVSDGMLAIFFGLLAIALVLGYLFLNKLVDISRQEDCMLSRSKSCAAVELPDR
jgi:hypothetical protein